MSGILVSYDSMMKDIEYYREIGEKYRLERSGNSLAFFINGVKYYTSTVNTSKGGLALPSKQLFFIQKVKHHIMKNDLVNKIKKNYRKASNIGYVSVTDDCVEGEVFEKPYSIDIKQAYWETAYKAGWINKEIYLQGLSIDKRIRLAALGTFAKRVYHYEFNGKGEESMVGIAEPKYPHVFFNQANTIYKVMEDCRGIVGTDFLFYWTDGVYVKNLDAAKKVEQVLRECGYEYKTERLHRIIRDYNGFQTIEKRKTSDGNTETKTKSYKYNFS
jgi:hypothetical protein